MKKKLNRQQLETLLESLLKESNEDTTVAFAKKVDKFFDETLKRLNELAEEGQELVHPPEGRSFDKDVAERNRFTMTRVGFLKRLAFGIESSWEALKRDVV